MTGGNQETDGNPEQVTVTDKRRIDPETGAVREGAAAPAPSGPAPAAPPAEDHDKIAELTADLQRIHAEFANYRKRSLREQQATIERAKGDVVSQLLGVLDDLDRARSHGDLESGPLKSVADKLTNALANLGVEAFGAEGDEFDPVLHEAVQHEGDGSKPVIGHVMRRGYRLGGRVLRHALVGVVDTVDDEPDDSADTGGNADAAAQQPAESEESAVD